jgi:hypothetical protein
VIVAHDVGKPRLSLRLEARALAGDLRGNRTGAGGCFQAAVEYLAREVRA